MRERQCFSLLSQSECLDMRSRGLLPVKQPNPTVFGLDQCLIDINRKKWYYGTFRYKAVFLKCFYWAHDGYVRQIIVMSTTLLIQVIFCTSVYRIWWLTVVAEIKSWLLCFRASDCASEF